MVHPGGEDVESMVDEACFAKAGTLKILQGDMRDLNTALVQQLELQCILEMITHDQQLQPLPAVIFRTPLLSQVLGPHLTPSTELHWSLRL